jgi:hypothetical protein
MTSLTVKIHNEQEEKVLIAFLDSLNYEYDEDLTDDKTDATEYLLSSDAMKKHLEQGISEANEGKVKPVSLKDLWK